MSGDPVEMEAIRVRVPFRRPIVTSVGSWSHRESWIVRLYDATGAVGLGEAALDFGGGDGGPFDVELSRLLQEAVERLRAGHELPKSVELQAAGVPGRALMAALDSALFDLRHVFERRSLARSVAVNATIGYLALPEAEAAARDAVAGGFGTIKMKVGPERDTDELVDRVAAVRAAAGPDLPLRLDANGAWDVATARERIAAVAPCLIECVEQPVPVGDPRDLAAVREGSPVPIGADESVSSVAAARELLAARAADVLVVKPARVGGPTAAWEIADMAAAEGVPVVVSTLFETGVGISAALAVAAGLAAVDGATRDYAHGLATADLLESDLLTRPMQAIGGRIAVPVGIALDEDAIRRYAVEWLGRRP